MLVNEWARFKIMSLLVKAGSGLGIRDWTEMEIRYVKGIIYRPKLVSSEKVLNG